MLDCNVCAGGFARCARGHSLLPRAAGCGRGDGDDGDCGDSGGYYYDAGHIESPPCRHAPLRPPLHPSPRADACGGASDQGPGRSVLPGHWVSGCAASDCDALSGGGCDGDGGDGGRAEVSLVQFSRAALLLLLLLFGPLHPAGPVMGLKGPLGLDGSPGNLSSLGL